MKFAIIIPTYREKENLERLLPILVKRFPASSIFVVDDNSKDQTDTFVIDFSKNHPQVKFIKRERKMGRGGAVIAGFKTAYKNKLTDYFLEMDADFSHDPEEIKRLVKKASPKTVVIGSRYLKGSRIVNWPKLRKILSRLANLYVKSVLQIPIKDYTNGFRLYPRLAITKILDNQISETGYTVLSETSYILYKQGFSIIEVPTTFVNRKRGKTKTNWVEYLKSLVAILRIRLRH